MGYLYYNGIIENDVICHYSDCLQFSVSLTVFPFMFDSVSEDLKLYVSWFINKLRSIEVLGSFYASFLLLKRYCSYTPFDLRLPSTFILLCTSGFGHSWK